MMTRVTQVLALGCWLGLMSGCRCFPAVEKYHDVHDVVDCASDFDVFWDRWYYPPWDVSRAGRPDWCSSSFNRWVCPCRCQQGVWYGYYDQQHYPPNHPYSYPSQAVPLQGILSPAKSSPGIKEMRTPEIPALPVPQEMSRRPRPKPTTWQPVAAEKPAENPSWMELE